MGKIEIDKLFQKLILLSKCLNVIKFVNNTNVIIYVKKKFYFFEMVRILICGIRVSSCDIM